MFLKKLALKIHFRISHDIGKLDILINCAGITGADKTTDQLTEEEWDQVLQSMQKYSSVLNNCNTLT